MSQDRLLYELQSIDLEIEAQEESLKLVEGQLGESPALIQARAKLSDGEAALAELEKSQRAAEWEIEDLRSKIAALDKKLYEGTVRNPKELTSLQHEVDLLKGRVLEKEDKALEIMGQVEDVRNSLAAGHSQLQRLDEEWRQQQRQLREEQARINSGLASLCQRRAELAAQVDPANLKLYQTLRERRQGRAVAKVEQGMCRGCRITLPMAVLQRARLGQGLVQCSSCERILYLS